MATLNEIYAELELILRKRSDNFDSDILEKAKAGSLSEEEKDDLLDLIADEMCEFELNESGEPTERGLFLDDIIGFLNTQSTGT